MNKRNNNKFIHFEVGILCVNALGEFTLQTRNNGTEEEKVQKGDFTVTNIEWQIKSDDQE